MIEQIAECEERRDDALVGYFLVLSLQSQMDFSLKSVVEWPVLATTMLEACGRFRIRSPHCVRQTLVHFNMTISIIFSQSRVV